MGVAGAGLATIISQFVSFVILLIGCNKGSNIHISIRNLKLNGYYLLQILRGGLPSLARQSIASIATISLNNAARPYGDVVIAAMGVVQRIMQFGASAMIGFGQGFQPFCGFNYGAKLIDRVKKGFWFCVKGSFGFLCLVAILVFAFAPQLVSLFRDDPEVIACGTLALRLQCCSFPFQSFIVMSNMMQQVTGKTGPATFMAIARQGIFFIPLVLFLPLAFDVLGIQMAQAISDLCTLLCAIPLQLYILRSISRES
jgi:Na+-driven multidrug efflux pump